MNKFSIPCTEEQTKKALTLGAPIEQFDISSIEGNVAYNYPTTEQMIGWLETQGISVFCEPKPYKGNRIWIAKVHNINSLANFHSYNCLYWKEFNTSKEATLSAIDSALEYLTENKK